VNGVCAVRVDGRELLASAASNDETVRIWDPATGATERILEGFYSLGVTKNMALSVGYQRITNPGYNRDRGPVDVLSLRLHAEL